MRALWIALLIVTLGAAGCAATLSPAASSPDSTPVPSLPTVKLIDVPETLCREATQIRLRTRVTGHVPEGDPTWEIVDDEDAILAQGAWAFASSETLAIFPDGEPLPPGAYAVRLRAADTLLATWPFTVEEAAPAITEFSLGRTPEGASRDRFDAGTHHIYVRYAHEGVCPGSPLWITVRQGEELLCSHALTLESERGKGEVGCYRENESALEEGAYRAELTLMGRTRRGLSFDVGAEPAQPVCGPLFVAAGVTPEGDPILAGELFEWYTQVLYVGSRCTGLSEASTWESRWYRSGSPVRTALDSWEGGSEGLVWDSLAGTSTTPFLVPGTYTVSLTVDETTTLTGAFRVRGYTPPASNP